MIDLIADAYAGAGRFTLEPRGPVDAAPAIAAGRAQPNDISMVLHTSGTTSRRRSCR